MLDERHWTTEEITDLLRRFIRDYDRRLRKAREIYLEQTETIARLRDEQLFPAKRYTHAPPDWKQQYLELLKKRKAHP
jgi:hypothetical protein